MSLVRYRTRSTNLVIAVAGVSILAAGCSMEPVDAPVGAPVEQYEVATIHATYPIYASVDDMIGASDTVVQGTIVGSRYEASYPLPPSTDDVRFSPHAGLTAEELAQLDPTPLTVYTMQVDEVVAGDVLPSQIEVMQVGGVLDGVEYISEESPLAVDPDAQVVLVLSEQPSGYFDLPNPAQGAFAVSEGETLEPLSEANELDVSTISDLRRSAEAANLEVA